jgi:hypothetical protein
VVPIPARVEPCPVAPRNEVNYNRAVTSSQPVRFDDAVFPASSGLAVALLAGTALLAIGCASDTRSVRDRQPPVAIRRACRVAAGRSALPVQCPARWPRHGGPGAAEPRVLRTSRAGYLIDVANGLTQPWKPLVFHVIVAGQRAPFDRTFAGTAPEIGLPKQAQLLGHAGVGGVQATLRAAPPYPRGGIHGGHVIVTWNDGGHGYLVSVHGVGLSRHALGEVALRLARSAVPVTPVSRSHR